MGCVGFWLWALVGAGLVIGLTSFVIFLLIPPVVGAVLLIRLSRWDGARSCSALSRVPAWRSCSSPG